MAHGERPFLFCRYSIQMNDSEVSHVHHLTMLQELQGKTVPHGRRTTGEDLATTLLMRPRHFRVARREVITFSVGYRTGGTIAAQYDQTKDDIALVNVGSGGIRYADFVAVPSLGVLAVDDRANEVLLGGKAAINRLKSVLRSQDGCEVDVTFQASPEEVRQALQSWQLTQFNFTIRPNNPRPVSRLTEALSQQMKSDGIGQFRGIAKPAGSEMRMSEKGLIKAAQELADAGYGQTAFSGYTEEGFAAQMKKPPFHQDRQKNEREQERARELRVFVNAEGKTDDEIFNDAAQSLIGFYANGN